MSLISIFAACAPDAAEGIYGPWVAEQEQRGDTLVVRTAAGSVWGDTMVLVAEVAIGELEGDNAYLIGNVRGLDVDSAGRIYVLDGQAKEVRVFSSQGDHLFTFGREGGGPGEFSAPDYLRVLADGRIVVRDQRGGRFSIFSADGAYLGGWLLRSTHATGGPFFVDGENHILHPTVRNPGAPIEEWRSALVRFQLDGTVLDTIDVPTRGIQAQRLVVRTQAGRATYSLPFSPMEQWTLAHDGRPVFGRTNSYSVDLREADGGRLRVERVVVPVDVAAGEAAQAKERIIRGIRQSNPGWDWQGPDIPATKPAFNRLLTGVDGTLWVFRSTPSVETPNPEWDPAKPDAGFPTRWTSPVVADVFDEGGRYLGPVKIPEEVQLWAPPVLTRDVVWAAALHPSGYPQVVRYRLVPAEEAAELTARR